MWILRVLELLMFAGGAALDGLAIRNVWKGSATRQWPQVQGRILRSFVLVHADEDGTTLMPQIEYEYAVEGTTYRGKRLRYGQTGSWTRKRAERVIAPYQAGASVPVFFHPHKPSDAVLVRGTSWGNALIALAGIVFMGFAYLTYLHPK